MKKDEQMRHISRIDQFKKRQHGWWVRIHRDGKMIQRFFSDYAHGGNDERALREAKRYRDALLIMYPKPERGSTAKAGRCERKEAIGIKSQR